MKKKHLIAVFVTALPLCADEPKALPQAQVIGPISPLEQYQAPVETSDLLLGEIDFPNLIAEPGANDDAVIAEKLRGLNVEFVGSDLEPAGGGFVDFRGMSRVKTPQDLLARLTEALTLYEGLPLTIGELRFMQQDITESYKAEGYPLMSVVVPPQEIVDGVMRLQINEFSLAGYNLMYGDGSGDYSIDKEHWSRDARLARILDPLLEAPILSQDVLNAKVKRLNINPYRSARVIFEPGKTVGETLATIQIDEQRPWGLQTGYNNHATEASGEHRFSIGGNIGNILFPDHQISGNATFGTRLDEFASYSLIYTIPNRWGHQFSANINFSDTASSSVPPVGSESTTLQTTLSYNMPIWSNDFASYSISLQGALKQFERTSLFAGVNVDGADFDGVTLSMNHVLNFKESTATNQLSLGIVSNLSGVTSNNETANFRRFYNYADGTPDTWHASLSYARVQQLGPLLDSLEGWSAETQFSMQFANDRLAGSETFSIGGPSTLRAYESSTGSGDQGYYFIQTIGLPSITGDQFGPLKLLHVDQLALSGFVEFGEVNPEVGERLDVWDAGVQANLSLGKYLSSSLSLAVAGKEAGTTGRGDLRLFIGINARY